MKEHLIAAALVLAVAAVALVVAYVLAIHQITVAVFTAFSGGA